MSSEIGSAGVGMRPATRRRFAAPVRGATGGLVQCGAIEPRGELGGRVRVLIGRRDLRGERSQSRGDVVAGGLMPGEGGFEVLVVRAGEHLVPDLTGGERCDVDEGLSLIHI